MEHPLHIGGLKRVYIPTKYPPPQGRRAGKKHHTHPTTHPLPSPSGGGKGAPVEHPPRSVVSTRPSSVPLPRSSAAPGARPRGARHGATRWIMSWQGSRRSELSGCELNTPNEPFKHTLRPHDNCQNVDGFQIKNVLLQAR